MQSHLLHRLLVLLALLVLALPSSARADKKGCTDPTLFPTRMPNYEIATCQTSAFEGYDFYTGQREKHREEGAFTFITYQLVRGQTEASGVAVVRNYENAFKKLGGTIVASDPKGSWWINGKVTIEGKEVWFQAEKGNGKIWLRIIEKTAMKQHVVANAAAIRGDLERTGHVAIEGIYFDTNKATIKPESTAALDEIAKLLKTEPGLKLWVVGHTDWVGKGDDNVKLAQARAEAVVRALTSSYGIAAARLKAQGMGPYAPVASNETDEGRTSNRRVELVKQP
jgi:outer membrane protein OmpA-like peptidoglycan-associated protein